MRVRLVQMRRSVERPLRRSVCLVCVCSSFFGEEGLIVEREKKILPHHAKRTTRLAGVASLFVVVVVVSFYFFLLWMTSIATCLSLGVG